jgi:beta-lactamase regulating signal transducer with metallopeptidase domain
MLTQHVIAWLLTYLLHGTLLLGLAWLVSKPLSRWSVAAEETVWKLALVGALFTATLQLGWVPVAGRWGLADFKAPAVQAEQAPVSGPSASRSVPVRVRPVAAAEPSRLPATPAPSFRLSMPSTPALALGAWALGALLLLAGYVRSFAHLGRRLKRRPRVVGGNLHSQLRSLAAEAGFEEDVRLTCSSRVPVPLALGLGQPEICVPPKALAALTDEQQEGMLAHELAHLARRDPLWLVISHVLACVFFFQPLNWVARRRLREISELLSDEWAVSRTGRPLSLAGCLAEVAGWSAARRSLPVPGMADRPSHLAQRIRRLLDGRSPESPARRIWLGAAMVVLLIAVAAAAPAVSAARQEAAGKTDVKVQATASAPGEHDVAEESVYADDEDDEDVDVDVDAEHVDVDVDLDDSDSDVDVDVEVDLDDLDIDYDGIVESTLASMEGLDFDAMIEGSLAGLDASLEALDVQLEEMSHDHALTEEEREKLEEEIERNSERLERTLRPRLEQLSREINEKVQRDLPTSEMLELAEEMKDLAERMRPSHEEMARLHALVDEEMRKHRAGGKLSHEERQRIAREAREMAERMRPTEEQRKAMEDLRRQHRELAERYRAEHHEEIEKATREMREDIQREMDAAREEMRRSMDQWRRIEREKHRDEMNRDPKRDKDASGKEKPPKMVLRMDFSGKLELVPETPGC